MNKVGTFVLCIFSWSCAQGEYGDRMMDEPSVENGDEITIDEKRRSSGNTCATRWIVQADSPNAQSIPYASARSCTGQATQGAKVLGDFIKQEFRHVIHGERAHPVEIYNCRKIANSRNYSVHSEGRALDVYIKPVNGSADNARGDLLANWLATNAAYVGIQYIIWDRTSWKGSRASQSRCYSGQHPHHDHIHVELTHEAARGQTPFFEDLDSSGAGSGATPPPMSVPTLKDWLGSPCTTDDSCASPNGQGHGYCFRPSHAPNSTGFCTVSCEGLCPDRGDAALTFCVPSNRVGGVSGGLCVAQASTHNGHCSNWASFQSTTLPRFVGRSASGQSRATVCVPNTPPAPAQPPAHPTAGGPPEANDHHHHHDDEERDDGPAHDVEPEPETEPEPEPNPIPDASGRGGSDHPDESGFEDDNAEGMVSEPAENFGNDGVCDDEFLELSDHDYPCPGVTENTWRCACSDRYEVPVSQVCRNGRWINYQTNPRDCSRCDGRYTSGCES